MSPIYDIPVRRIDGSETTLAQYRGDVLLIVNVASQCGLTPQYTGLEKLYQDRWEQGLQVLGFPANNFAEQEPGSDADIEKFCTTKFDVHFPLFAKVSVTGADRHPLYEALVRAQPLAKGGEDLRRKLVGLGLATQDNRGVLWNFEKFLVSRAGEVVGRFAPDVDPQDPGLLVLIDKELGRAEV